MAVISEKKMRDSLMEQLGRKGKDVEFYRDMIEDYIKHWKIKKDLVSDIKKNGIRYSAINGNGIEVEKQNESVERFQKETLVMLKILNALGLEEPTKGKQEDAYY